MTVEVDPRIQHVIDTFTHHNWQVEYRGDALVYVERTGVEMSGTVMDRMRVQVKGDQLVVQAELQRQAGKRGRIVPDEMLAELARFGTSQSRKHRWGCISVVLLLPVVFISVVVFAVFGGYQEARTLDEHGVTISGRWEQRWTEVEGRRSNRYTAHYTSYTYEVNERPFTGVQKGEGAYNLFDGVGEPVEIIYNEQQPSFSRLSGNYMSASSSLEFLGWLLLLLLPIAVFLVFRALPTYRKAAKWQSTWRSLDNDDHPVQHLDPN